MVKYLYTLYKSTIPRGGHIQLYILSRYQLISGRIEDSWTGRQAGDGQEDKQEMDRKTSRRWSGR